MRGRASLCEREGEGVCERDGESEGRFLLPHKPLDLRQVKGGLWFPDSLPSFTSRDIRLPGFTPITFS